MYYKCVIIIKVLDDTCLVELNVADIVNRVNINITTYPIWPIYILIIIKLFPTVCSVVDWRNKIYRFVQ